MPAHRLRRCSLPSSRRLVCWVFSPVAAGRQRAAVVGITLLVLGMITAFVGGLYALMEHNIQRLLAYHTLENIGIILLGLGAGVTGNFLNQPALIALGLTGGLYHLVNHSLFKSVLFLGCRQHLVPYRSS